MSPISAADLAYMRGVQAAHRPTAALLQTYRSGPDGMGGRIDSWPAQGTGVAVMVRIDMNPDAIPTATAARFEGGTLAMLTLDLIDVRAGDRIEVSATEVYEVVTEGDTDRWATAQQVVGRRNVFARTAAP